MTATRETNPFPPLPPSRRARKIASARDRLADAHHQLMDLHLSNLSELDQHPNRVSVDGRMAMQELAEITDLVGRARVRLDENRARFAKVTR